MLRHIYVSYCQRIRRCCIEARSNECEYRRRDLVLLGRLTRMFSLNCPYNSPHCNLIHIISESDAHKMLGDIIECTVYYKQIVQVKMGKELWYMSLLSDLLMYRLGILLNIPNLLNLRQNNMLKLDRSDRSIHIFLSYFIYRSCWDNSTSMSGKSLLHISVCYKMGHTFDFQNLCNKRDSLDK